MKIIKDVNPTERAIDDWWFYLQVDFPLVFHEHFLPARQKDVAANFWVGQEG
jgi:hypothetical protein